MVKRGSVGDGGRASRSFFGVEAALVEEVAKRRLARKLRLAAERRLVARRAERRLTASPIVL